MQCYKEGSKEPMELDNSTYQSQQNIQTEENKVSNDPNALINEATSLAEHLNNRLKSLNEKDAHLFMENFEMNVMLLPKKKNVATIQHEQLTAQKSDESNNDFVMVNPHAETKNYSTKTLEKIVAMNNENPPLFSTSAKPPLYISNQNCSFTKVKTELNEREKQGDMKTTLQEDKSYHIAKQPSWEFTRCSQRSHNSSLHRSMSEKRKIYSSDNSSQLYSDVVKGNNTCKQEHSTTFPSTISSEESVKKETSLTYSTQNRCHDYRNPREATNNSLEYSKSKPRSVSNHNTHRNQYKTEKLEYNQSTPKMAEQPTAASSRPLDLHAIPTQVANVAQQQKDWLQGIQKSLQNNNKKSINILVLGQTGVGKSTWINAFANYLSYSTLEDAIAAEAPVCVIPTKFSMFDENYQRHDVLLGNHCNEVFSDKGQSATQNAKTYLFETEKYNVYIIDTPGMDDTRGGEQDDENMRKILRTIAPFKELHAICFLFKANEARLSQSFRYCISKLLSNLSKSALNNTCFVFTNARGTFYKPGDTMAPLKGYFKELQEKEGLVVAINDNNTFCLDNEAFRFICAYFSKIKFGGLEMKTYADSWKHSANEMIRLLDHASRIQAHNTSETLSINETRTWILQLVEPIINVGGIIQTNLQQLEERIRELESMENNIEELQKRAAVPIVTLEVIHLESPQTVCRSEKCISYENVSGIMQPIYKTVCHKNCNIFGGDATQFPDPALYNCEAFNYNKCKKCGCHLNQHGRIFYEQRLVTNRLEVQAMQNSVHSQQDAAKLKRKMINRSEKMIDGFTQEFYFLMNAMSKFSFFLFQNGISHKSDIFENHIQRLIESEEKMIKNVRHCDERKYYRFVNLLMSYRDIREKTYYKNFAYNISLAEIQDIRQKLFSMPLTGSKIAEVFDIHVKADKHDYVHDITHFDKKSIITKSVEWIKNQMSSQNNAFVDSDASENEVDSFVTVQQPPLPVHPFSQQPSSQVSSMLQQPQNNFTQQHRSEQQQPDNGFCGYSHSNPFSTSTNTSTPYGFQTTPNETTPASKLDYQMNRGVAPQMNNQFQPQSQNEQQQHHLPSMNPSQQSTPMQSPMAQNPNMNFMQFMQDPNFLQQMAMFMQQMQNMQLAQQNETMPMPGFQNNVQRLPSQQNYGTQAFPFSNSSTMPPQQQQAPSAPLQQHQQYQQPNKNGKTKSNNSNNVPSQKLQPPNTSSFSGPRKEVYILVLGETGVGKSTWINGIANYMSFDVITEALEAPEPVCVIPSKFTMCDDNYQQREIIIGNSNNEVFGKGQSATQDARTYMFQTPKYDVYIIDTPGIGDVRGIEQDKENTRKILNAIAPYKNLHAICLLFKSNEARMTLSFRYCISELLLQLHRDAAKNIVFFFTNSRGTFYKPGDTIVPLREFLGQLQKKHGIEVSLNRNNIFCLDNEAFKFVCAYHDGVDFSEEDMLNFASSWKRSAEETHRFLDYAAGCKPHSVDKTLSVNQARGIILQLAKPLADINDLIETNIKVYNDRKNEIENTAATIDELKNKLLIPQVGIKTEPLPYPMTVCTGEKCIETQSIPNSEQRQTIYKQICHDHCQLDNVDPERFPEPHLQQCWAMQGRQSCHICGCQWSTHMHIRFKQVKTNESVEDENIKNAIQTNEDARITKQKIIESCEQTVNEYKHEQKIIMEASIRFAVFLKQNAIMAYNDVFEKYVEKSIEEEEKCIRAGGDHSKLNNLKRCLAEYRQERATIEQAILKGGNNAQQISTDDVKHMKSTLFALPHFGAKLKELFNRTVQGYALNQQQSVQKFAKPNFNNANFGNKKSKKPAKNQNVMNKLRNVFVGNQ
uniref:G domain-containing protein n=1 Tax=Panagrolaimus sp. PS1159 TaxID=55785 RepID=A0AC35GCA2_9BILA